MSPEVGVGKNKGIQVRGLCSNPDSVVSRVTLGEMSIFPAGCAKVSAGGQTPVGITSLRSEFSAPSSLGSEGSRARALVCFTSQAVGHP